MTRQKWFIYLLLGVLGATAVVQQPVFAHAELVAAFPAPGSSVPMLNEIRLTFSEPIAPGGQIELLQDFIPAAELQLKVDPDNANELGTAVPPLPNGIYTVQWKVTTLDGHAISGSYSLGLNSTPPQPDTPWCFSTGGLIGLLLGSLAAAVLLLRRWQPASSSPKGND